MYNGYEGFAYVLERSDNGKSVYFRIWCPLRYQVAAGVDECFFDVLNDNM